MPKRDLPSVFLGWFVVIFSLFYFVIFDVEQYRAPEGRYIEVKGVVAEGRTPTQVAMAAYRIGERTYRVGLGQQDPVVGDTVALYARRDDPRIATQNPPHPNWERVAEGTGLAALFGFMAAVYWTYMQFVWLPWRRKNRP